MRRNIRSKRSIIVMLVVALFLGQTQAVFAAEPVVTTEIVTEPTVEEEVSLTEEEDLSEESPLSGQEAGEAPEVNEEPEASEAPEASKEPKASEEPEASEAPEASEEPKASEEPEASATPEASEEPKASEEPETSATPEASEVPEVSATPEVSASPEVSSTPEEEATPSVTPSELPTETPSLLPEESPMISPLVTPSATPEVSPSLSPTPSEMPEDKLFPEMKEGYELTAKELEEKKELQAYVSTIKEMTEGIDFVRGEVLVSAETEELAKDYADAFGGYLKDYFDGLAIIGLNSDTENPVTVAEAVEASASLEYRLPAAWPNYIGSTSYEVGLRGTGGDDNGIYEVGADGVGAISKYQDNYLDEQWYHEAIGSELAWKAGYTGDGITVAVLSTGINISNQDINSSIINYSLDAGRGNGDGDNFNQGTHMATVISAIANNAYDGCGIAHGIDKLIVIDLFGSNTTTTDAVVKKALTLALNNGADIICLDYYSENYSQAVQEQLAYTYEVGVPVICSAGDYASNSTSYPAAYEQTVAVAALNQNKSRTEISNYGKNIRYGAPGAEIQSAVSNSGKANLEGTGQAAAIVAAEAAVILSAGKITSYGSEKVDDLLALMDKSCEKVSGSGLGKGMPSLIKALNLSVATKKPNKPVFETKGGTYYTDPMTVTISAQAGTTIYYSIDGKNITYKNGVLSANAIEYTGPFSIGDKSSITVKALAIDNYGKLASSVSSAKYTLKPRAEDIIISAPSSVVLQGSKLQLKTTLIPAYSQKTTIEWQEVGNWPEGLTLSESGLVKVGANVPAGSYMVRAAAPYGQRDDYTFEVVAKPQNPVKSITVNKNITLNTGNGMAVPVTLTLKDGTKGDPEELIETFTNNEAVAYAQPHSNGIYLFAGVQTGKAQITLKVKDGSGKKVTINVTVKQPVTSITIKSKTSNTVIAGKSVNLYTVIGPENASNKKVEWYVRDEEDKAFISVNSSGKVTTKKNASGTYWICAKAKDGSGKTASALITVTKEGIKSIELDQKSVNLFRANNTQATSGGNIPKSVTLKVKCTGANTKVWTVENSNPGLVTVVSKNTENNTIGVEVTGNATGTANITVKSADGSNRKSTCKITVSNPPTGVSISLPAGRRNYVAEGKTLQLTAVLEDDLGTLSKSGKKLQWSSSNPDVIKVDQKGKITCKGTADQGARITVKTTDGSLVENYIYINITETISKIELKNAPATINMTLNQTASYEAYATNKAGVTNRVWQEEMAISVNKEGLVAYYDDSSKLKLKALKAGTYKVTISLNDGNTAKKTYTVKVK